MTKLPTLYKRAHTNKINEWTICSEGANYWTISGEVGGKLTQTKPSTAVGMNIGKANETTPEDQATKEALAKWGKKCDQGYTIDPHGTDDTGYAEPMLAKQFLEHEKKVIYPCWADAKLNGVRCWRRNNEPRSRKNKPFNTLAHIDEELQPLFDKYPGLYLDGELYNPNLKNQHGRIDLGNMVKLISVAIKPKDITPELLADSKKLVQYHCYDGFGYEGITTETPFIERRKALQKLLKGLNYTFAVGYTECKNRKEIDALLEKSRKAKLEGLIIRFGGCPYVFKRSDTLLKLKNWITEEFEIVEIVSGSGDWQNLAKQAILKLPKPVIGSDGKAQTTFSAGIEGDMVRAKRWYNDRANLIGKFGSVTYGELSKYGVPLTPVMEEIRNYE